MIFKDLLQECQTVLQILKIFLSLKASLMMLPDLLDATESLEFNPLSQIGQYKDEIAEYTNLIDEQFLKMHQL